MKLSVDRLVLSLHGISADIAKAAVENLSEELSRTLGGPRREWLNRDIGVVLIGPVETRATADAGALRGLIAERLALALGPPREAAESEEEKV
jgi:NAD(P)-dependent dehydrogenase (short-subunit alcohol dehydrogenase family)